MERVRFRLDFSADEIMAYYRGAARQVSVLASDGRRIQFPADALRRHVTASGVHGLFELRFGADRRLLGLERIGN
jgi:hypothetical protein